MAQQPHYNPQQQQAIQQRQNANLRHMLDQKPPGNPGPGGMGMQQAFANVPQQAVPQQAAPQEKTIIDAFEAAFQSCLVPLMPGGNNMEGMAVSPEKLRSCVEHSIQDFTEQARKVESYFLTKHAMVALRQPELILQEEIEDLKEEINRRDGAIRNHANRVAKWRDSLRNLENNIYERASTTPGTPNPQTVSAQQAGLVHPDMMPQMPGQRR